MKLVVGLGNPTRRYEGTRHNVGFQVANALAKRWQWAFGSSRFDAEVADGRRMGERVALVKPLTYMNESGQAVGGMARYFDVLPEDVIVVYDDVDLPLGQLRLRRKGSAGSHNGMRSVLAHLGTTEVPRLRVGIGAARQAGALTGHVLGKFTRVERDEVDTAVQRAADCVEQVLDGQWDAAMGTYNARLQTGTATEE